MREAEEFVLIEVPDNVRKIVILKAQVHGVMTYKRKNANIKGKTLKSHDNANLKGKTQI